MAGDATVRLDRRREALFRQLALINGGVVYVYDIDDARRLDNWTLPGYLADLLGYPKGYAEADTPGGLLRLFHPNDKSLADKHIRAAAALANGQFATINFRMRHFDGGWRWLEAREVVFNRTRAGAVRRMLGFASDISERRRLTDSLAGATEASLWAEAHELPAHRPRAARFHHPAPGGDRPDHVAAGKKDRRRSHRPGDHPGYSLRPDRGAPRDPHIFLSAASAQS